MKTLLTVIAWVAIWFVADMISQRPELFSPGFWREVFIAGGAGLVFIFITPAK